MLAATPSFMLGATLLTIAASAASLLLGPLGLDDARYVPVMFSILIVSTTAAVLSATPSGSKLSSVSMQLDRRSHFARTQTLQIGLRLMCIVPMVEALTMRHRVRGEPECMVALCAHTANALAMLLGFALLLPRQPLWTCTRLYLTFIAATTLSADLHLHWTGSSASHRVFPAPGGTSTLDVSATCALMTLLLAAATAPSARQLILDVCACAHTYSRAMACSLSHVPTTHVRLDHCTPSSGMHGVCRATGFVRRRGRRFL